MTLKNLSIGYGTTIVADNINIDLKQNSLTCLIGRNGTGKSTLMRTMTGVINPLRGEIIVHGQNISKYSSRELAKIISIVTTGRAFVQNMTVMELVSIGRTPYTDFLGRLDQKSHSIIQDSIRIVGMEGFQDRKVNTLSDGELQKIMIAKALAQQTPYIFLDEPTAFLDYPSKKEMLLLLRDLCHNEGKTILVSTHDLDVALKNTDYIWLIMKDAPKAPSKISSGEVCELEETIKSQLFDI